MKDELMTLQAPRSEYDGPLLVHTPTAPNHLRRMLFEYRKRTGVLQRRDDDPHDDPAD